jgi:streptogramin lyase
LNLPHGIAIDKEQTIYVADRENGRIQRFTREGKYLSEIPGNGNKTFSLHLQNGALWIGCQPRNEPNGAPGWIMKLDPATGAILGQIDSPGHHSIDVSKKGEILTGVRPDQLLWFRLKKGSQ